MDSHDWVWAQNIGPATKLVLMALARAARMGTVVPDMPVLQRDCRMKMRTVQYHLQILIDRDIVESTNRSVHGEGLRLKMQDVAQPMQDIASGLGHALQEPESPLPRPRSAQDVASGPDLAQDVASESGSLVPSNSPLLLLPEEDLRPEEREVPEWYEVLMTIPKFDRPLKSALAWVKKRGITGERAFEAATALAAKWDGKKYKAPWPAFQNWATRPSMNGQKPDMWNKRLSGPERLAELGEAAARHGQWRC